MNVSQQAVVVFCSDVFCLGKTYMKKHSHMLTVDARHSDIIMARTKK